MDKSALPRGKSSTSSPQQPQSPIIQSTQRQSMRPSPTPHSPSPTLHKDVSGLGSSPPDAPPTFTNSSSSYPSPPLFGHGVTHAAPQSSLPHAHPSHMVHSSPPFVYHHHPGTPGREASMSHMAYAPPSMVSILRQHAPVYSHQGASTEPAPSPHRTHGAGTTSPLPVYPRHTVSPSHSLAPRQASSASTGDIQHLTSYASPGPYSPLGYTTPPPFAYPPTSFVPAPSVYGSHYPHHTPSYGGPPEQENQGAWWYLTPSPHSQFSMGHPSSVPRHEGECSSQTRTASHPYPSTSKKSPFLSRFGDPSEPRTETRPSSLPSVSTSSIHARTTETSPSSESRRDWPQERRSYHPKTPALRSEWVMWVGNVPSDATPDELQAFFNRPLPLQPPSQSRESPKPSQVYGGVSSVFLIARSNCAFVNFESKAQLEAAVAHFHGKPIRPDNPPCPRLVCRVRKRTDDLKAGVGAQRGRGMHVKWIKEQKEKVKDEETDLVGLDKAIGGLPSPLSTPSTPCSSISGSLGSTDSGILTRYFPQRYFILKSLTQHDLDLSVQRNIWATQPHNEEILDQAYRTSKDVFIIFGVNKSGEFYGYSRMASQILHSKDLVPWASRPTSPVPLLPPTISDAKGNVRISPPASIDQGYQDPHYVLSPEEYRDVEQSPKSISPPLEGEIAQVYSAPAELHNPHRRLSQSTENSGAGPPRSVKSLPFELDADGPYRALRDESIRQAAHPTIPLPSGENEDPPEHSRDATLQTVAEELSEDIGAQKEGSAEVWGRPFRVDWIRTNHLSFSRTRHLRNPWNHGREVKISRDGTELEPSIGRQLLEEWDKRPPSPADT